MEQGRQGQETQKYHKIDKAEDTRRYPLKHIDRSGCKEKQRSAKQDTSRQKCKARKLSSNTVNNPIFELELTRRLGSALMPASVNKAPITRFPILSILRFGNPINRINIYQMSFPTHWCTSRGMPPAQHIQWVKELPKISMAPPP